MQVPDALKEKFARAVEACPGIGVHEVCVWEDEDCGYMTRTSEQFQLFTTESLVAWVEDTDADELPIDHWLAMGPRELLDDIGAWRYEHIEMQGFDGSIRVCTEDEYRAKVAEKERAKLESEVTKLLRKWDLQEVNEDFLNRLQANPLYWDEENRAERRAEAFGAGGMQGLDDYNDACSEYNGLYSRIEDWIASNIPLLYARWKSNRTQEVQA